MPEPATETTTQATAEAAANIAFIKYWGARDLERAVPHNPSISMTLRRCRSRCAVELEPDAEGGDEILLAVGEGDFAPAPRAFAARIQVHLDRLREIAGRRGRFRVHTRNSFPAAAGLASSASGFAALTLAVTECLGMEPSVEELSVLARRSGSGSAARSVMGGYVEWPAGEGEEECYAKELLPAGGWDLCDVIAIVEREAKKVSSLEGHRRAETSPYYAVRQAELPGRLDAVRRAIRERDFAALGPVIEEEAIDLHLIAMSSRPPIFYWKPATLRVLEGVRALREEGIEAYATMDAGANVHVLTLPEHEDAVAGRLTSTEGVDDVIRDGVGPGPRVEAGFSP